MKSPKSHVVDQEIAAMQHRERPLDRHPRLGGVVGAAVLAINSTREFATSVVDKVKTAAADDSHALLQLEVEKRTRRHE